MENNKDFKLEKKEKFLLFFNKNKIKIFGFILIIIISISYSIFNKISNKNKNSIISQKYIQAGLYLSSNETKKSKDLYHEIILTKNKFYAPLALNVVLEKNLENNEKKVLNYFEILDKIKIPREQRDLITFKKALYFLKNSKNKKEGQKLLQEIIDSNSYLKSLATEIIKE